MEVLLCNGVVPFRVFDGLPLPAKSLEPGERRRSVYRNFMLWRFASFIVCNSGLHCSEMTRQMY